MSALNTEELLWIDGSRIVNLAHVLYIQMGNGEATIILTNGEKLKLEGADFKSFQSYVRNLKLSNVNAPASPAGFQSGRPI